jgi:hypothetical protein
MEKTKCGSHLGIVGNFFWLTCILTSYSAYSACFALEGQFAQEAWFA